MPQALDPRLQLGVGVQLGDALVAGAADVGGAKHHQRHAVVDAGDRRRRRSRRARCRSAAGPAQTEPAVSRKLIVIGAALPGTPSMRASPSYSTRPPGVCTRDVALHVGVAASARAAWWSSPLRLRPARSRARTAPPRRACCRSWAWCRRCPCRAAAARTGSRGRRRACCRGETMPTLLVSGCAPPRPSIWRLSGEPITASSTRSRVGDVGRQVGGIEERARATCRRA